MLRLVAFNVLVLTGCLVAIALGAGDEGTKAGTVTAGAPFDGLVLDSESDAVVKSDRRFTQRGGQKEHLTFELTRASN